MYFAPGATHAPHHVPKEWIAKYKGKFDQGWDRAARGDAGAAESGWAWCRRTPSWRRKPEAIKDWDSLTADEKKLFARQMEVFAGFGEYTDTEIGRLIKAIEDIGQLDNTLIFYIVGDNGASAEGGMSGMFNEMTYFNGVQETVQDILKHYDELGGPIPYSHYARRMGGRGRHAVHLDQTGRLELRRHAQRDGRPLAEGDHAPRARCARSGTTSSTSRRRFWRRPDCRSRKASTARHRRRSKA